MILVVGGAGYIGSHFVEELIKEQEVLVLDNFSTGHKHLLNEKAQFIEGNLGDEQLLNDIFSNYKINAVIHFAASSLVGESVLNPMKYYENNVSATITLLKVMMEHHVKKFIFSSTAATYGIPTTDFITEETAINPINPYGKSKLMVEWMLEDFSKSYGLSYVILRYFNAAGAHVNGRIGENHSPETHLIPIVLEHLLGIRESISVFGNDYPTEDGTCIRDYIHVTDLANAHLLSLNALLENKIHTDVFNLGNGSGYSVMEVIKTCEDVTKKSASIVIEARRTGDPSRLVASSEKITATLGWKPVFDLVSIVETAWKWHSSRI
ncbi:UDP-glucose 4-epimerase GalE [Psychrobacillus glaciei]|uniref:UDP-glucose 4-epimerase n=1 Tax=Psychrobacillus glaciei TaxID=2283160 RepID=A0A5J6SMJ0_9BACI|nr:UDP-glucose 4-epimerase GalE [Psychrobacillus glaciei]QFF97994.1 UDP-glucose 4-epimerase GalE [Psychrobacillus glaciei]